MDDLISRQAAIDAIEKMNIPEDMCVFEILSHIEVEIATLPTIQPEVLACGNGELVAQPEPTDIDAKEAVYNLAEKIGIHQLFALTVELRGEPIQPELTDEQVIDYCGKKGYKIVADDLFDLLSKSEPHWIPVSERLPETEEFVLASLTGKYRNTTFEHACEIADYADGEWCIYAYPNMSAEKCAELIEAWMPLPEAYKPSK